MTKAGPRDGLWDVVVVGGGPAGAAAAFAGARSGASTLLLDRATFPRYKTCGGGLIGTSLGALPDGASVPVRDEITAVTFTYRGRFSRTRFAPEPILQMVYRDEFDAMLVATAAKAGVTVQQGTFVKQITEADDSISLTTSQGVVSARSVVGADGSASRIASHVGVKCETVDLGLEVEVRVDQEASRWTGRVHLDWGPLPGSYGWVFPKGDVLTVGVIAAKGHPDKTRRYLADFLGQLNLQDHAVVRKSGHITRSRTSGSPLARGRVLVAGDAAGLLEPWTREGISFALRSGKAAGGVAAHIARASNAQVAAKAALYETEISETLQPEIQAGRRSLRGFERHPLIFHTAITLTGPGWAAFGRISRGETTLAKALRHRSASLALRILEL